MTLNEAFVAQCELLPNKDCFVWLDEAGKQQATWTFQQLRERANAVAHALLEEWDCVKGDRVVLMYLPGLDFIAGFWGCMFTGVIAVPVYPVDLSKFKAGVDKFKTIVASCEPKLILSHSEYILLKRLFAIKLVFEDGDWPDLEFVATDELGLDQQAYFAEKCTTEDIAFLQFTSGSTGNPKGVMLTHGCVHHNVNAINSQLGEGTGDISSKHISLTLTVSVYEPLKQGVVWS